MFCFFTNVTLGYQFFFLPVCTMRVKTESVVEEIEYLSCTCCNLYQDITGIFYCSVVALFYLSRLSCDSHVFLILVSTVSQMFLTN